MKYLEAENDYSLAVEQDVVDVDNIEALQIEVDRLEVFKPTSSNLVLSVEQVRNKIELYIETNDVPRARPLTESKDMNGFRSFKEVITESTKILLRLLSILINILHRPSIRINTFLLLLLFMTSILFWHELTQAERDRQEKERIIKEEKEKEEEAAAERDRQEKERLSVEAVAQVRCSPHIRTTFYQCISIIDLFYIGYRTDCRTMERIK